METVTAVAQHEFVSLSAREVFDAWTDPALLRVWMERHLKARDALASVTRLDVVAKVGGRFHFADTRPESDAWGYYRVLERPHRIVFTWFVSAEEEDENSSVVTLDITPKAQGSVATIRHEMDGQWADYIDPTAKAWGSMLAAIDDALS